eukprot:2976784-Pleurochrysis_carterae.AAC.1
MTNGTIRHTRRMTEIPRIIAENECFCASQRQSIHTEIRCHAELILGDLTSILMHIWLYTTRLICRWSLVGLKPFYIATYVPGHSAFTVARALGLNYHNWSGFFKGAAT